MYVDNLWLIIRISTGDNIRNMCLLTALDVIFPNPQHCSDLQLVLCGILEVCIFFIISKDQKKIKAIDGLCSSG